MRKVLKSGAATADIYPNMFRLIDTQRLTVGHDKWLNVLEYLEMRTDFQAVNCHDAYRWHSFNSHETLHSSNCLDKMIAEFCHAPALGWLLPRFNVWIYLTIGAWTDLVFWILDVLGSGKYVKPRFFLGWFVLELGTAEQTRKCHIYIYQKINIHTYIM